MRDLIIIATGIIASFLCADRRKETNVSSKLFEKFKSL
jgi:hypothetical protein